MADWERPFSALVDPPLASPPSLADLEERARRHRTRRRVGTSAGACVAVMALVVGVMALGPSGEQTVHTAADGGAAGGAAMAQTAQPFPESATVLEFDANGARWKVVALRQLSGAVCLGLLPQGANAAAPQCWTPDDRPIQAAAAANADLSYVFGIASKAVTDVAVTAPTSAKAQLFGQAAGYPVNFFGYVVPAGVNHLDLEASLGGGQPFLLGVTVHARVNTVNGQVAAPPAPTTTVVAREQPGSVPPATPVPTTAAPPTSAPPATTPPTTAPPLLGIPKLITITTGASNLNKIRFESAVASGSNALAVRFWAGVEPCTVLGKVDVVESADKVTVTLWTGTTNSLILCTALAQYFETIVPLSAPLGARVVVDGGA